MPVCYGEEMRGKDRKEQRQWIMRKNPKIYTAAAYSTPRTSPESRASLHRFKAITGAHHSDLKGSKKTKLVCIQLGKYFLNFKKSIIKTSRIRSFCAERVNLPRKFTTEASLPYHPHG